jgi:hypothetical protein
MVLENPILPNPRDDTSTNSIEGLALKFVFTVTSNLLYMRPK